MKRIGSWIFATLLLAIPLLGATPVPPTKPLLTGPSTLERLLLDDLRQGGHLDAIQVGGIVTGLAWSGGCHHDQAQIIQAYQRFTQIKRQLIPGVGSVNPCEIRGQFAEPNVILTVAKGLMRDCLNNNTGSACSTIAGYKFHGIGTNSTAATASDTGCGTEITTQYNPNNTRATGTQTTNGSTTYRTVGTNTVDASVSAVEWCLFTNATVGSGTALSHVVYSTISLVSSDALQTTYDFTFSYLGHRFWYVRDQWRLIQG